MKMIVPLLLAVIVAAMTACTLSPSEARDGTIASTGVAVEVLYAGTQCGRAKPDAKVSWVLNAVQLQHVYNKFQKGVPPTVDFDHDRVVLLEMGQRPTLGYRLVLSESVARIAQGHVEIVLEWVAPASDMMVGQMLTSPCLLLKLERGSYRQVWFKNQTGVKKATLVAPQ